MNTPTPPIRHSPASAAQAAGCSRTTIYRALESGDLHGAQRSAKAPWRIRQDCLEAWLDAEQCVHQAAQSKKIRPFRIA